MENIPVVKIPHSFFILIIGLDKRYNREDELENLFINQAGVSNGLLVTLDSLSKVSGKNIGLVIYVDRHVDQPSFSSRFRNFFLNLKIAMKCRFKKVPSIKIYLSEKFEDNIMRMYNIPKVEKIREIIDSLKQRLVKNYKLSSY